MGQFHALKNVKMGCSLFQYKKLMYSSMMLIFANTGSGLIGVLFMDCIEEMLVFEYRGKMTITMKKK